MSSSTLLTLDAKPDLVVLHARLSSHASEVKKSLDEAKAALLCAQEHAQRVQQEFDRAATQRDEVKAALDRITERRAAEIVQRLPLDLLREVFSQCTTAPANVDPRSNFYDCDRATAPFYISSVCKRWRNVALHSPSLWSYLGFPERPSLRLMSRLDYYTVLVRARSRNVPMEIYLDWQCYNISERPLVSYASSILNSIAAFAERWQKVTLGFPTGISIETLNMFRQVTPLLEELTVWCGIDGNTEADNAWRDGFPVYLPHCPKMRRLDTDTCHIVWTPPRIPSTTLVHLRLNVELPPPVVWNLLLSLPALETLALKQPDDIDGGGWVPSGQELCLPKLHSLHLLQHSESFLIPWTPYMSLPVLDNLIIHTDIFPFRDFFEVLANKVSCVEIKVVSRITIEDCAALVPLRNVKHLIISSNHHNKYAGFYHGLVEHDVWPLLETIKLDYTWISETASDDLIELVCARQSKHLRHVSMESCQAPKWLKTNIDLFLKAES